MMKIFSINVAIKTIIKKGYAFYNRLIQGLKHNQWVRVTLIMALFFALLYLLALLNISADFDDAFLLR